eukprot:Rmarinus@m.27885
MSWRALRFAVSTTLARCSIPRTTPNPSAFASLVNYPVRTTVQHMSILDVADNSGAIKVKVINVPRKKKVASEGDKVIVSVRKARADAKAKKGDVFAAVVVRLRKPLPRPDGMVIRAFDNACVLLAKRQKKEDRKKEENPLGTRVYGPVASELRKHNFGKIIALAEGVY